MKLRKKTVFRIVFTMTMMVAMCIAMGSAVYAAEQSWTSGDCTVTLNDEGVMTVSPNSDSSTGVMADYTGNDPNHGGQPWGRIKNNVKSLVIKEGVTSIGENGFCYHQNLSTVKLPSTIKSIGYGAFVTCADPTVLYINAAEPPELTDNTFFDFSDAIIYVPHDYVDKYASHKYWGQCGIYDSSDYVQIPKIRYLATEGGVIEIAAEVVPENAPLTWKVTRNDAGIKLYSDSECHTEIGPDFTGATVYARSETYGLAKVAVAKAPASEETKWEECKLSFSPQAGIQPAGAGTVSVYPDWEGSTPWCLYQAEPKAGFVFDKWEYELGSVSGQDKITKKGNNLLSEEGPLKNVVAHFKLEGDSVACEPAEGGIASVAVSGDHFKFKAVANEGYEFEKWTYRESSAPWPEAEYENIPVSAGMPTDMVAHFKVKIKDQKVTPPQPIEGLVYTGEEQELVTPAEVVEGNTEGTILYTLEGSDEGWSKDIPTAIDAGTYKVHIKVKAIDGYDAYNNNNNPVEVTIAQAEPEAPTGVTAFEGQTLENVVLPEGWTWKDGSESVGEIGTHTFKADYTKEGGNYKKASDIEVSVKVKNAPSPVKSFDAKEVANGNKVYMGTRYVDGKASPISWIVLGDANSEDLKDGENAVSAADARLMITEKNQYTMQFNRSDVNTWQGSDVQNWLKEAFLNGTDSSENGDVEHFSSFEKATMLATSKTDPEYHSDMFGSANLENEKVFLLSVQEVREGGYLDEGRAWSAKKYDSDEDEYWWLRTPYTGYGPTYNVYGCAVTKAGYSVRSEGHVNANTYGVRPACNFDLNKVLFTSLIKGTDNEYKLTLKDENMKITAGKGGASKDGNTFAVPYEISGADAAKANQVLVLVTDTEYTGSDVTVLQYAKLKTGEEFTTKGSGTFDLDEDIAGTWGKDYHVYMVAENAGGSYETDYASALTELLPTSIDGAKVVLSKASVTYNGKVQKPSVKAVGGKGMNAESDYALSVTDSKNKIVYSPKTAGKYTLTITGKGNYIGTTTATFTIKKAANTLKVSGKTVKIKKKKIKKKAQNLAVTKVIKFTNKGQGKLTYKLTKAKKGKKNFKKKFKINAKTGKVTVKKKLKKGTYKVTVKVTAAGNANYNPATRTVTFKVKVK